jgi:RNA 2',3'-cyclic 3'-phosphodiesterase
VRLFTGIELGEAVRTRAVAAIAELRQRVERNAPHARVTWIAGERLHLTVRFIGEVSDSLAGRIVSALRAPLPMAPFTIAFDAFGAFPPRGAPRVIWIGVAERGDAVVRVESALSERLLALGIAREDRAYSPHLTLARVRQPAGLRTAALFDGLSPRLGRTRVDAITLFQSKLSPKGPTYVVLERTPLRTG